MKLGKILGYTAVFGPIAGGFAWLYTTFTPLTAHYTLAADVKILELDKTLDRMIDEKYRLKYLLQRNPNDEKLNLDLEKVEEDIANHKAKIKSLKKEQEGK